MHNENNETSTVLQSSVIELKRFGERVREVVGSNSARSFARSLNISDNILRKYMDGKSDPSRANLIAIARLGGVNLEWLSTGDGPKYANDVVAQTTHQATEEMSQSHKANIDFLSEFVLIPSYNVQVSVGWGCEGSDKLEPTRHLAFRKHWLKWRGFAEKDLTLVWAKGDSMDTTISNNDILLVHMQRTTPTDGNIFVIRNENQLWVKRVQIRPNAWLLLSDNKLYPPIKVPMGEQNNFQIIGQVVHISKDIGD